MSDFLDRMASRSQGAAPVLRPRLLSLFEGAPERFEEVHLERDAPSAPRPDARPRGSRRAADPSPAVAEVQSRRDLAPQDPWPEAEPERAPRPSAPDLARPGPEEAFESPVSAAPGEAAAPSPRAAPASAVAPVSGLAPASAGSPPAAVVRRRVAEAPAAASVLWGRPEPLPPPPAAAGRDPDPEAPAFAPARLAEPARIEESRRGDASAQWPASATFADDAVTEPFFREPEPRPRPASPPAKPLDTALQAVPPRSGAAVEGAAPDAVPASVVDRSFAPREQAAPSPAPVEIRIGRIDIHAAPPAAPAAPAEAPGPTLDAFLARPRR